MTHALIESLLADGPVVTDGAWGTQFFAMGLESGRRPDVWNVSHPDRVHRVAHAYVDAGSDVILTNTFQANRMALGAAVDDAGAVTVASINRAGVEISRRAAGGRAKVFASMGPSNALLVTGDVTESELADVFTEQASALADAGPDGIVVETMSDLDEAAIAVAAAAATGLPVVACMTYDTGKKKDKTMMGVTPSSAARRLEEAGAAVVGANCGVGVDLVGPVCEELVAASPLPVWIKANAGTPELVGREVVYGMTPTEFARHVELLVDSGASFVGGCCGTTPAFITAIDEALTSRVE